jgi:hypothetical protein
MHHTRPLRVAVTAAILVIAVAALAQQATEKSYRNPAGYPPHDRSRPYPVKVEPGEKPGDAPSDAIVLFDGSTLDHFRKADGSAPGWKIAEDKSLEVVPSAGDLFTKQEFADAQIHLEFKTNPASPGSDQHRSNSGVKIGPYEIQILDTYENKTYPDGMAGAIYGQYPPQVNATRKAGDWQTLDIVYRAPRFADDGSLTKPAAFTVHLNGVLVLDAVASTGPTSVLQGRRQDYKPHGPVSIMLQDHRDDPIWFRNIWARPLDPATW